MNHVRSSRDYRIGIVGCGPRGLYCLQSLADQLQQSVALPAISIVIFEPSEFPGAGNVYAPSQPDFLRMNFAAKQIDAWTRPCPSDSPRLNLVDWLKEHGHAADQPEGYVSRGLVGRYLNDCFQRVVEQLQRVATVNVLREAVSCVGRLTDSWQIRTGRTLFNFDDIVLTVGHGHWQDEATDTEKQTETTKPAFIPTFPVERNLTEHCVPPGSDVAVRGFGLTWIDTALALTEGRGGEFHRAGNAWTYHASGREPKCLYPVSRSGRPMLAKPDESLFAPPQALNEIWMHGKQSLDAITRPITGQAFKEQLWPVFTDAAATAVNLCSGTPLTSQDDVATWFDRWCQSPMNSSVALETMKQSFAVATGQSAPDIAWALGAAWRNLYPALVRCINYGGLSSEAWPNFRKIAAEMERIAFGPPAENVGRILALVDAGLIDLHYLAGSMQLQSNETTDDEAGPKCLLVNGIATQPVDVAINAVLPSPQECTTLGPLQSLLDEKTIGRLHGTAAIEVDAAGRPLRNSTGVTEGLAIMGRATEGCVLGNDTLSRTLHDHPQRWAESVIKRIHGVEILA
ncbi:FAD/NAD(P)-binding protein [Aporhodopirellula aestuarii]|uniref:FAD/NAD(P)-binding protein n=1 Tax=Aporhodopirellula aestuarii TaxID=2950107 RepID=UPI00203482BB|nr:FAD/NAD(P)-binding domain-containing protein [Aporhodopirellula aestuarii]